MASRLSWAIQPLGILTGTLSLLDLASIVIEWRSFLSFIVNWWSNTFLDKARDVALVALEPLGVLSVSDAALNYALLGALLFVQSLRARKAMGPLSGFEYRGVIGFGLRILVFGVLWPATLAILAIWTIYGGTPIDMDGIDNRQRLITKLKIQGIEVPDSSELRQVVDPISPEQRLESFLITAPFWLFLTLCIVNSLFAL